METSKNVIQLSGISIHKPGARKIEFEDFAFDAGTKKYTGATAGNYIHDVNLGIANESTDQSVANPTASQAPFTTLKSKALDIDDLIDQGAKYLYIATGIYRYIGSQKWALTYGLTPALPVKVVNNKYEYVWSATNIDPGSDFIGGVKVINALAVDSAFLPNCDLVVAEIFLDLEYFHDLGAEYIFVSYPANGGTNTTMSKPLMYIINESVD